MVNDCQGCSKDPRTQVSLLWFFIPAGIVADLLTLFISLAIWLMEPRLKEISLILWNGVFFSWIFFLGITIISFFMLFTSKKSYSLSKWAWILLTFFFQASMIFAKFFQLPVEKIQQASIKFSNLSFDKKNIRLPAEQILILVPHCIQKDTCGLKVTIDAQNCKRCGQCSVGALADIEKNTGVHLAIVPGGTLARKRVKEIRPKAILAIACERDLTSGIQDVFPLPVFGVLNTRPFGPCVNTQVDIQVVQEAIDRLIK